MRRAQRWIVLAGTACVLSWIALITGLLMQVDTGIRIALATAAAVTTEGTFWLAALLLGVSVYQARQRLWATLKRRFAAK
ncbi:MAG TPA: hypothetical protein VMR06_06020 [Dokdonella sp.]|nr:hypothetical protein [Dokdonella sp.]